MLAPSVNAQQPLTHFEEEHLANGLTVILHRDTSSPVAALVVMYHVGSKNEEPGRTGFAHLFEHMMFKGSEHVADGEHFKLLQEIGATVNGSTTEDRTNYFEIVPSNYLELALCLESDRMGFLLPAVNQAKLDNQRDVVRNERRQNYDNLPYGTARETIAKALYPADHPYSWPVIGSMEDLSAASLQDVKEFFRIYYAPNNACLVVAGDFEPGLAMEWIRKYFGFISRGREIFRPAPAQPVLAEETHVTLEDNIQLPRLFITWHGAPYGTREEAVLDILCSILSSGKNSRLYRSLVFAQQIAQNAAAYAEGGEIAGTVTIDVTAKPGNALPPVLDEVDAILEEILRKGVTETEIQAALNGKEAQIIDHLATVFGKANGLASSFTLTGDAENFNRELDRFAGITPAEVQAAGRDFLAAHRVILSVVPRGKAALGADPQATGTEERPE